MIVYITRKEKTYILWQYLYMDTDIYRSTDASAFPLLLDNERGTDGKNNEKGENGTVEADVRRFGLHQRRVRGSFLR